MSAPLTHGRRRLTGRDPSESHRASTPLELLYDLTVVVALGIAADQLAHYVAEGHVWAGVAGFAFAVFAICWAWLNYTWFASAYDTDDWVFRLATMTQMGGVVVLALGLEQAFASIDEGGPLDNGVMVSGYVVMRLTMLFLWWRVSRDDPERAPAAHRYMLSLAVAQVGWVVLVPLDLSLAATAIAFVVLILVEMTGPMLAERVSRTPWHPDHIAERYGLLVIITLGEGIIGTVAAINAVVHSEHGWTLDAALVTVAGIGLTFGAWWMYFVCPWPEMLRNDQRRAGVFGYGHLVMFGGLAAMGGGLHVAAYALEGEATIGEVAVVASVAIPVAIFVLALYVLYAVCMGARDRFHLLLLALTGVVLVLAVLLAAAGVGMSVCLIVLALAPIVTIVGYETIGHRHLAAALADLEG